MRAGCAALESGGQTWVPLSPEVPHRREEAGVSVQMEESRQEEQAGSSLARKHLHTQRDERVQESASNV